MIAKIQQNSRTFHVSLLIGFCLFGGSEIAAASSTQRAAESGIVSKVNALVQENRIEDSRKLLKLQRRHLSSADFCYCNAVISLSEYRIQHDKEQQAAIAKQGISFESWGSSSSVSNLPRKLNDAYVWISRALASRPRNDSYLELRADIFREGHMYSEAVSDLTKLTLLYPTNSRFYLKRGRLWLYEGNIFFSKEFANCPYAGVRKAVARISSTDDQEKRYRYAYEEALKDANTAVGCGKSDDECFAFRAMVRSDLHGDPKQIVNDYTAAIKLNPNKGEYYSKRAQAWSDSGNNTQAIADLNNALELEPHNVEYELAKAKALFKVGRIEECESLVKEVEPRATGFYLQQVGDLFYSMGRRQEAIKVWTNIDGTYDLTKAAYAYQRIGDKETALSYCDIALKKNTGDKLAALWLKAQLLKEKGRFEESLRAANLALKEAKHFQIEAPGIIPKIDPQEVANLCSDLRGKLRRKDLP